MNSRDKITYNDIADDGGNCDSWMRAATEKGLDADFISTNKLEVYASLQSWGLPGPMDLGYYENGVPEEAARFFTGEAACHVRLIPHEKGALRPYRIHVWSMDDLHDFVAPHDLSQYTLCIAKGSDVTYAGCTVVQSNSPQGVVSHLQRGSKDKSAGKLLFHGGGSPKLVKEYPYGTVSERANLPLLERRILSRAMDYIERSDPLPGYFEWFVRFDDKNNIDSHSPFNLMFGNYKLPKTSFAKF